MTIEEGTKKAFERYAAILYSKGISKGVNLSDSKFSQLSKLDQQKHVLWMCEHCLSKESSHYSLDKKSRWLGFVQCTLIMHGYTEISIERNITRPWLKGTENGTSGNQ